MARACVHTKHGPRYVRVCDYCKAVPVKTWRFCSGHCARNFRERARREAVRREVNESEAN